MQNDREIRQYVALRDKVSNTLLTISPTVDCPRTVMDCVRILFDQGILYGS